MAQDDSEPQLPVPISFVDSRYLLFDIKAITWLRKHHNICGVFIGTLPQNPSQNVFMGLPMEIMPEEAQLLIELGIGYILDDARVHDAAMAKANRARRMRYVSALEERAIEISTEKARDKEIDKKRALKRTKPRKPREDSKTATSPEGQVSETPAQEEEDLDPAGSLFAPPEDKDPSPSTPTQPSTKTQIGTPPPTDISITPTASSFLPPPDPNTPSTTPQPLLPGLTPSSYNLYRHLHHKTYFMTPGLRFGCQFCVYPGDPLRFHSHFLARGVDWDEEIDLMDVVGGGRLGTGVKKGWLFGGRDEGRGQMRTFSVEWAAM
ncbi:tRNA-splicing endonuclease subunit [Knufia obscura]|uniref:tRNA-splicing endonuclease subunit Sen34 n=2 Tax=Knufia TaxID=430999 RepID=A0AAN8E7Z5_9EURO|nr:tRNA-splicing endonuclease subunit [Knufia obscura]KAK5948324.1 tRNA-splicing endonuclease subunit [Knufia fluminis]